MFQRSLIALTAASLLTATAGVAIATADQSSDTKSLTNATIVAATTPNPLAAPVAAVEPAATKAFKAFKNQSASPMPADVAAGVASPGKFGRNANLARSLDTPKGKGWLIPGRGYVCLAVPTGTVYATTCQPTQVAATDGLQIGVGGTNVADDVTVTTVAPTGSSVVAVTPSGATTDVPTNADGVSTTTVSPSTVVDVTAP